MVIEQSKRSADYRFAVSLWIPRNSDARLNIVGIGLYTFLQAQQVIGRKGEPLRRLELWREFHVVTYTVIQCEIGARAPRILPEHSQGLVVEGVAWTPDTLDKVAGKAGSIGLHCREVGERGGKAEGSGAEAAKVVHTTVVHSEDGVGRDKVEIDTKFRVMPSQVPGKIVDKLIALFNALNIRIGLASKISITWDIHRRIGPSWNCSVVEIRQAPSRELKEKFIHFVIAQSPSVFHYASDIAVGLLRSARVGILTKRLVLAADLDAGDGARTDIGAQRKPVTVAHVMVEAQRVQAGALEDREVSFLGCESLIGLWHGDARTWRGASCGEASPATQGPARQSLHQSGRPCSLDRLAG